MQPKTEINQLSRKRKEELGRRILRNNPEIELTLRDDEALKAEMCRRNFFYFVKEFIGEIIPGEVHINWHIPYLCDVLQGYVHRVIARLPYLSNLIINIPPGTTKSSICSQLLQAWSWIADLPEDQFPEIYEKQRAIGLIQRKEGKINTALPKKISGGFMRFICVSYNEKTALAQAKKHKMIVECDKYRRFFPDLYIKKGSEAIGDFWNCKGGQRWTVGVKGGVMSQHADMICIDDPVDPKGAASADREAANEYIDESLSTRKTNKKVTPMITIMQRLHVNDPTGYQLKKALDNDVIKNQHICLPGELRKHVNPPELKEKYVNGLLDPVLLDHVEIKKMRATLGPYGAAGQIDQVPVNKGEGLFDIDNFVTLPVMPHKRHIQTTIRYLDKSGTEGGGDYTAMVLMHRMKDSYTVDIGGPRYIIEDVRRGKWGSIKRNKLFKEQVKLDTHKYGNYGVIFWIEQEPGSGGKESAEITIRELAGYKVYAETKHTNKVARAEAFSNQVDVGDIGLVDSLWTPKYKEELAVAPMGANDDQWDCSAGAFNKLALGNKRAGTW